MSTIATFPSQVLFAILLLVLFSNVACVTGIAKTFYLHTQGGNPNAAWEACASYGATMVKIQNKREYDALLELVAAQPAFAGKHYWIGLFHTHNNQFSWSCSDQLGSSYDNWEGSPQPGVYDSLHCVEVRTDQLWYSASCASYSNFICERKTGPCVYVNDTSFAALSMTSPLATQSVNTVSECHDMCENFDSGKSCFYVLYRALIDCTLLESKPSIISGSGEYSGYSRKCYTGETRTEPAPVAKETIEPPTKRCIATPLPRDQTVESRNEAPTTSSEKTTAFADKTTVVPSVETTLSFPDEITTISIDKTTIVSAPDKTATPSDEAITLQDSTTVVHHDKTTVVFLDETTVLSRVETTENENKSLFDLTTTEAHWTVDDGYSATKIQTSAQSETTIQHSATISQRTSANTNTLGLAQVDRSSTAIPPKQLFNPLTTEMTRPPQYTTSTSILPNVLSTVDNLTPEMPTVRTSTNTKTQSLFSTSKVAEPNVVSSLGSVAIETVAGTMTRGVRTSETPELSTATLEKTAPEIALKNTKNTQNECYCPCAMSYSAEEKEKFMQMILDGLSMDRKVISAYVRTLTSAPDPRLSAKAVGCTGLVILVSTIVSIVLLDFTNLFRDLKTIKESWKTLFRLKFSKGIDN